MSIADFAAFFTGSVDFMATKFNICNNFWSINCMTLNVAINFWLRRKRPFVCISFECKSFSIPLYLELSPLKILFVYHLIQRAFYGAVEKQYKKLMMWLRVFCRWTSWMLRWLPWTNSNRWIAESRFHHIQTIEISQFYAWNHWLSFARVYAMSMALNESQCRSYFILDGFQNIAKHVLNVCSQWCILFILLNLQVVTFLRYWIFHAFLFFYAVMSYVNIFFTINPIVLILFTKNETTFCIHFEQHIDSSRIFFPFLFRGGLCVLHDGCFKKKGKMTEEDGNKMTVLLMVNI